VLVAVDFGFQPVPGELHAARPLPSVTCGKRDRADSLAIFEKRVQTCSFAFFAAQFGCGDAERKTAA
jgi:hypothetical protein